MSLLLLVVGLVGMITVYAVRPPVSGLPPMPTSEVTAPQAAVANGQRIYFTDTDSSGRQIRARGGMMGMAMPCANCHGPDGHGEVTRMFRSPNITYRNLTDPAGMLELDGDRGPTYTDATIKRAVTQGIGADGARLEFTMPRFTISDQDLDNLISFLQTLQ